MARSSSLLRTILQLIVDLLLEAPRRSPSQTMAKHPGTSSEPQIAPKASKAPAKRRARKSKPSRSASSRRRRRRRGGTGSDLAERLRAEVSEWRGVPYRLGGTDRSGVDCSGFLRTTYRKLFGLELPRTTREQAKRGRKVTRSRLRPGDLVFFKISRSTRHVGAWVGDGEFVHASSSRGVTVSRLDSTYWRQRFWTARRVL